MIPIICTDRNGITHNYNPRYVVDAYKTPSEYNKDWCITIIFGKDSGLSPALQTIIFKDEKECDEVLNQIIYAIQSI